MGTQTLHSEVARDHMQHKRISTAEWGLFYTGCTEHSGREYSRERKCECAV